MFLFLFFENSKQKFDLCSTKILPSLARFVFEDYLDISSKLNINFNDKR